ncbi:transporter [Bordetella pertussis]|nr:transporter [Bordetella pertussis]
MRMGGDGRMVAAEASVPSEISTATIPLWLTAAAGLGAPN